MNLVDCYVTRVLSEPEYRVCEDQSWWEVWVEYNSWGRTDKRKLWKRTEAEALQVVEGFHFLA